MPEVLGAGPARVAPAGQTRAVPGIQIAPSSVPVWTHAHSVLTSLVAFLHGHGPADAGLGRGPQWSDEPSRPPTTRPHMRASRAPPDPAVRPVRCWPLGTSGTLLAVGALPVIAETENLLPLVGLGLVGLGLYGLARPRRTRSEHGAMAFEASRSR